MNFFEVAQKIFYFKHKTPTVDSDKVSSVYDRIEPTLDSLKAYDKGEKEINAPDLKHTLSDIQRTAQTRSN